MFETLDGVARIVGYIAIAYVLFRLLDLWLKDRRAMRAAISDREWLDRMRIEQPEAYKKELWRRDNYDRFKAGLPTDPDYIAEMKGSMEAARRAGVLDKP